MPVTWREITSDGYEVMTYKLWEDIGLNISMARTQKGLSRKELADAIKCTESRIKRYEFAEAKVNLDVLEKLSKSLDVTVEWLINARIDSQLGECLYSVWIYGTDIKFYWGATSTRMAFFKINERVRLCGRRYLQPGQHACVKLVGTPVTDEFLKNTFTGKPDDDGPVDKQ